ncbi:hypothetical protein A676_01415 [Salmonella enterica subsp. enterica serovar Enteritidis str. 2010K-0262]|uniref:Uncharacterized protein n=2 Tax=Salmonella enterica I TaxID=59201 RepID=M7RYH8_SALDU|nr:hypothetical protein A670_03938 [Salmonella enterica subsp. enterica serovar Dublin str. UC16]EPI68670.1 hypothetical protein A673_02775 [Salmonella enterica subsp. enterica serovar Enteritidis str. 2009K0958]EPI75165.1 hypothetical protein A671_00679 [Salmonella enterica subsp. enterica serovar Dublin str. DG22]EPI75305.1 hypothetical protein A672_01196 [Salmonella enterica subsp. enterica serovar Enteritidis str. 08-1080]EPI86953.1 hypothetical protein A674_02239 [Salmonella enterica subsp
MAGLLVKLRRAVRAGPSAIATADAFVGINAHDAVARAFMHSGSRAILGADRVRTVIAGNRKRISKYVIADPALPGRDETSALDFIDAAETTAYFQIVFVFAGHLAGFTTGAA